MRKRTMVFIVLGAVGTISAILVLSAAAQPAPFLPGLTVKDETPGGCVDCHKNAGAGKDTRLNVSLPTAVKDHPDIAKIVKTVPTDCGMCHKPGQKAGDLGPRIHVVHYAQPEANTFVTVYQGACLNCHALGDSGTISVKSGPRNW
jgi:cytochrome c553